MLRGYFFTFEVLQPAWNLKLGIHVLKSLPEDLCSGLLRPEKSIDINQAWTRESSVLRWSRYLKTTKANIFYLLIRKIIIISKLWIPFRFGITKRLLASLPLVYRQTWKIFRPVFSDDVWSARRIFQSLSQLNATNQLLPVSESNKED